MFGFRVGVFGIMVVIGDRASGISEIMQKFCNWGQGIEKIEKK
jgi:hypothetical protein